MNETKLNGWCPHGKPGGMGCEECAAQSKVLTKENSRMGKWGTYQWNNGDPQNDNDEIDEEAAAEAEERHIEYLEELRERRQEQDNERY